jgi:hypothetical protein
MNLFSFVSGGQRVQKSKDRGAAKVLLIVDKPNWAYAEIARELIKANKNDDLILDYISIKEMQHNLKRLAKNYDLIFPLGWQLVGRLSGDRLSPVYSFLDPKRVITGIHSHHAWDNLESTPAKNASPPGALVDYLAKFKGVNAVSNRLVNIFTESGVPMVNYTPNGVNVDRFRPCREFGEEGSLTVGYAVNEAHDKRKGISEYLIPACAMSGIETNAVFWRNNRIDPADMPDFYNSIDVYLCASLSEGFSLSVLEASACGRPVVSTRVGGCEELISDGENGFLVNHSVEEIQKRLRDLLTDRELLISMGARNREIICSEWSWESRATAWLDFIKEGLR